MSGHNDTSRHDIGCLQAIELFYAYLDGELANAGQVNDFEHHLEHCRSCFSRAEFEGLLTERLRQAASRRASAALEQRLNRLMESF